MWRPSRTTARIHLGGVTYGGHSDSIVVDEAFTLRISGRLDLAAVAPLLCAGITTYSPLRHWQVGRGQKHEAFSRLLRGDVKYRFVIDMASLASTT